MVHHKGKSTALALGLCVSALVLIGCSRESDDPGAVPRQESPAPTAAPVSRTAAVAGPIEPTGWQTVSSGDWSFEIPDDWVDDASMYYPAELADRLMPGTVCQIGTVMSSSGWTVEDTLESSFGPPPWTMTPVTVCNEDGHLLEANDVGRSSLSLVFEDEEATVMYEMPIIKVFDCSTFSSRFGQYESIFRRILESTRCREE